MTDKHEFAMHVPNLKELIINNILVLKDKQLIQRIGQVLRLRPNETCVVFDADNYVRLVLKSLDKKQAEFAIMSTTLIEPLQPSITIILPLLKRDDLEASVYSCAELGANTIQLVATEKVHRSWGGQKELERLQRIIIAAAEQSKNFAVPSLQEPISLQAALNSFEGTGILFDPEGTSLSKVIQQLEQKKPKTFTLVVGPEAGLTTEEVAMLKKRGFIVSQLTPTILRARQAVALGLGIIRSFF